MPTIDLRPIVALDDPLVIEGVRREVVARLATRGLTVTALPPMAFAAVVGQAQYDMLGGSKPDIRLNKQVDVARQVGMGTVPRVLPRNRNWQAIDAMIVALDLAHAA